LRYRLARNILLFILTFLVAGTRDAQAETLRKQPLFVREVLSGDTVRLKGGKILKYIGLQAPPLQSIVPLVREYGKNSMDYNKTIVEGKTIQVAWGSQIRDDQGNLLGYVFLEDGTFVNQSILKEGHARALITPPNIKFAGVFRKSELEARRQKKGLWKEEPDNPFLKSEYLGDKVTKIYYYPTSSELERIPQSQIVTFRSRVEAKAAGYRPCFDCRDEDKPFY
jgi:micrococcal nuclease